MCCSVEEERVCGFLRHFIQDLSFDDLARFLRFSTGTSVCCIDHIMLAFNSLEGVSRRPTANTCGCVLHLPTTFEHTGNSKRSSVAYWPTRSCGLWIVCRQKLSFFSTYWSSIFAFFKVVFVGIISLPMSFYHQLGSADFLLISSIDHALHIPVWFVKSSVYISGYSHDWHGWLSNLAHLVGVPAVI